MANADKNSLTSPWPKKLKFQRSRIKTMLITIFDSQGIVHKESVHEGKTANAEIYEGVMVRLLKCIQQVHPAAFCSRDFFLLHDSTCPQSCKCLPISDPKKVTTLYHPLYSPNLPPPDYFLFPWLEMKLNGLHFVDVADIQEVITDELKRVQKEVF